MHKDTQCKFFDIQNLFSPDSLVCIGTRTLRIRIVRHLPRITWVELGVVVVVVESSHVWTRNIPRGDISTGEQRPNRQGMKIVEFKQNLILLQSAKLAAEMQGRYCAYRYHNPKGSPGEVAVFKFDHIEWFKRIYRPSKSSFVDQFICPARYFASVLMNGRFRLSSFAVLTTALSKSSSLLCGCCASPCLFFDCPLSMVYFQQCL